MVLLSHPTGNANSRQALQAFCERDMLAAFYTTVAWNGGSVWNKLLPVGVGRELNRRAYPGIPERLIHTAPARELCRVVLARAGMKTLAEGPDSPFSVPAIYRHADRLAAEGVRSLRPDAVYAYDGGALETFRAARRLGVKTVYELPTAHWRAKADLLLEEAELVPAYAGSLVVEPADCDWVRRKDDELALADQVIVPSRFVQSTLPAIVAPERVRVIPYGAPSVPAGEPRRRRKDGKLRVLYAGTLTQRKGLSYLLEAIGQVESAVEFTMIGVRVGSCQALDAALDRHRWLPTVPHSVVLEEMSQHDVLAFPTLCEGFALVILEAMSRGMTVVTTANSGALGIVRDGIEGFIVPIRSSDALAEKLELLNGDRDLLEAMRAAALERARQCTWQKYRELLAATVEEIMTPGKDCNCV
jgi:glycosyltransferase involved in cell wall biosynthesis